MPISPSNRIKITLHVKKFLFQWVEDSHQQKVNELCLKLESKKFWYSGHVYYSSIENITKPYNLNSGIRLPSELRKEFQEHLDSMLQIEQEEVIPILNFIGLILHVAPDLATVARLFPEDLTEDVFAHTTIHKSINYQTWSPEKISNFKTKYKDKYELLEQAKTAQLLV